ncbi:MAG: cob(I)yrinic acid a,c-diamide adenosyltransferase [Spirochaetaceae bacterium]|jgi:cob(I)alamin adenosyltransferase|nr:cob(I)yrinic acid a,c-diamide adenosyltransferase [Spirochaetaceae bacterium]
MIHIYTGEGKGKSTAAVGLAVRAAGRGKRVVIVQFLKGSETGELAVLGHIPNITLLRNSRNYGFFHSASGDSRAAMRGENTANLEAARAMSCDMLILDEVCAAYNLGAVDRAAVDALILNPAQNRELVLTGRDAPEHFVKAADYVSEIRKVKHPFDAGIAAREGIEY